MKNYVTGAGFVIQSASLTQFSVSQRTASSLAVLIQFGALAADYAGGCAAQMQFHWFCDSSKVIILEAFAKILNLSFLPSYSRRRVYMVRQAHHDMSS